MYCTVYPLRRDGKKLHREEIEAGAMNGWIVMRQFKVYPGIQARLWRDRPNDVKKSPRYFAELTSVELKTVDGGILIQGNDSPIQGGFQRQAWWIVPDHSRSPPPVKLDPDKTITEYQPPIMGLGSFGDD